jgi:hypothetical protein
MIDGPETLRPAEPTVRLTRPLLSGWSGPVSRRNPAFGS